MADTTRTTSGAPARGTSTAVPSPERDNENVAERAVADAKNLGTDLITAARETAGGVLDEQRRRAADEINAFGEALRRSVESFDESSGWKFGRYADQAARQIGDVAEFVRSRSWSDLGSDIEDFARRWPFAFMASAVAIGFVGGRFLLSNQGTQASSSAAPSGGMSAGGERRSEFTGGMTPGAAATPATPTIPAKPATPASGGSIGSSTAGSTGSSTGSSTGGMAGSSGAARTGAAAAPGTTGFGTAAPGRENG